MRWAATWRAGEFTDDRRGQRRADLARADAVVQTRAIEWEHWREMQARCSPVRPMIQDPTDSARLSALTPTDARGGILVPFDGAVLAIGATSGELVDTNRMIFSFADLSLVWVMANVQRPLTTATMLTLLVPPTPYPWSVGQRTEAA
jgi:membrane fusion protein, heavy metal efflux system